MTLLVVPGGSRGEILGEHGDALRVKVAYPPERGQADAAVVALLADALGIRRGAVEIAAGHGARRRTAVVHGVTADAVRARLSL